MKIEYIKQAEQYFFNYVKNDYSKAADYLEKMEKLIQNKYFLMTNNLKLHELASFCYDFSEKYGVETSIMDNLFSEYCSIQYHIFTEETIKENPSLQVVKIQNSNTSTFDYEFLGCSLDGKRMFDVSNSVISELVDIYLVDTPYIFLGELSRELELVGDEFPLLMFSETTSRKAIQYFLRLRNTYIGNNLLYYENSHIDAEEEDEIAEHILLEYEEKMEKTIEEMNEWFEAILAYMEGIIAMNTYIENFKEYSVEDFQEMNHEYLEELKATAATSV